MGRSHHMPNVRCSNPDRMRLTTLKQIMDHASVTVGVARYIDPSLLNGHEC